MIRENWGNLKYIVRHKWFVFVAGRKLGVSLWRLLIHDWTKILPIEWRAYRTYFYGEWSSWDTNKRDAVSISFAHAWLRHIHWNKHHWQYWVVMDDPRGELGITYPLVMPEKYVREMVADWQGAGRAITGKWDAKNWYESKKGAIMLHPETRTLVESLLAN